MLDGSSIYGKEKECFEYVISGTTAITKDVLLNKSFRELFTMQSYFLELEDFIASVDPTVFLRYKNLWWHDKQVYLVRKDKDNKIVKHFDLEKIDNEDVWGFVLEQATELRDLRLETLRIQKKIEETEEKRLYKELTEGALVTIEEITGCILKRTKKDA